MARLKQLTVPKLKMQNSRGLLSPGKGTSRNLSQRSDDLSTNSRDNRASSSRPPSRPTAYTRRRR